MKDRLDIEFAALVVAYFLGHPVCQLWRLCIGVYRNT